MRLTCVLAIIASNIVSMVAAADGKLEALEEQAFKQAAALADPSIVRIETVGGLEQIGDEFLANGPTSGVIVSSDGYIISSTFNFVSKPASILVTLPDGRRLAAKQIANDRLCLLTLLKIDADGLTPAKSVSRNQIKVGQWAMALGRTLDNSTPSLSVGIVSAVNRVWGKAIQTDAKTSPVNYGGALIDIEGRVLGVIAPMSPTGSGEMAGVEWYDGGIGFAIPMEDVYASLEQLKRGSDLLPGLLGITFAGGQALNVPAVVDRVRYNSPAQQAGLKTNDLIIEADREPISRVAQLKHVMGRKYAGDKIQIVVKRGDQQVPLEVSLVGELIPYEIPFLGILPHRAVSEGGPRLRYVFEKSPAQGAGLNRDDQILKLNGTAVTDARSLSDLVGRSRPGDKANVTYLRDGQEATVELKLSSLPENVVSELSAELVVPVTMTESREPVADATKGDADSPKSPDDKSRDLKTGRFSSTLEGHDHDYWAYVPENEAASRVFGLVVWIHPGGDTMEAAVFKQWKSICDRRGLILVAPKSEKPAGWQPGEAEFIKALVAHFRDKYSIDASRITLHSYGSGAAMTWLVANKHRDFVRGVVVVNAAYVGPVPENEPDFRQQFFFVAGEGDKLMPKIKASVTGLRKLKFPVSFSTVKALGTKYPPEEVIDEIGRWVDSLDRI